MPKVRRRAEVAEERLGWIVFLRVHSLSELRLHVQRRRIVEAGKMPALRSTLGGVDEQPRRFGFLRLHAISEAQVHEEQDIALTRSAWASTS